MILEQLAKNSLITKLRHTRQNNFIDKMKTKSLVYNSKIKFNIDSSIAQSVEQLAVNQLVAGSSPARGALFHSL